MLNFGQVSHYLGYNALEDFFPRQQIKPNPQCDDRFCQKRQKEYEEKKANEPVIEEEKSTEVAVVHEENEWGIECVEDEEIESSNSTSQQQAPTTVQGLKFAYDAPERQNEEETKSAQTSKPIDLSSLRNQLKGL